MLVASQAARTPAPSAATRVAVTGGGSALTAAELASEAARIGARSRDWPSGSDPSGAVVGVLSDWTPAFAACLVGLSTAGWAVGVLDSSWTEPELAGAVEQLDPATLIVADDCPAALRWAVRAGWVSIHAAPGGWTVLTRPESGTGCRGVPVPTPDTVFYVGFTSGSAGRPRAFARSHRSWRESFTGLSERCPPAAGERILVAGPLSSSHFLFGLMYGLHVGATVELTARAGATPSALARRVCDDPPPDAVVVVPTMLAGLIRDVPAGRAPAGVRVYCAGAALSAETRAGVAEHLPGWGIVEYYGASELSFVTIQTPGDGTPPGSVGRAFPGVEITIRDEEDRVLPSGVEGTIFARGPLVFSGYRGVAPEGSGARQVDGWWTVGDRGRLDDGGNLYVAGRGTALIITGGVNVQPEEVEGVIEAHPQVAACVVVGVPHPAWGEEVVAVVVPEGGVEISRAELRDHVAAQLARAKRPRRYVALDTAIPLGRTGKVDRPRVQRLVMEGRLTRELR